jgi:hypothetical protein
LEKLKPKQKNNPGKNKPLPDERGFNKQRSQTQTLIQGVGD